MGVGKSISSDTFFVGGHLWQIQFYPDGYKKVDESGQVYVSLYIKLVSKCEEEIRACFEYVLLDHKQSDTKFAIGPYMNDPCTLNNSLTVWGFRSFYKRTELEASQFIKDDCLTIQCTVGVVKTSMYVSKTFAQSLPLSNLRQSYQQLLVSREGSDVSFEVEGEIFYAHKLILSTRSPVFKAQFFGPLKEENTRYIKIEEMQAPVFKALLHFIYCDVIPDLGSKCVATMMSQHLLVAADRYGMESLRSLCESRLCKNITVNTVASSLVLAEQYGCSKLKSTCLKFIGLPKNLEAVIQTDGFKNLKESCPTVIDELLKSVAQALLRFIYCDVISDFDSKCATFIMTQHLLATADRYGIERLRSLCELRLCENITINNVASTLILAEQHACFQLKSTCLEFLGLPKNLEVVMRTDGFKNLKENCPAVIDELLKSIIGLRDFSMVSNEPGIKELGRESFNCYRGVAHICGLAKRLLFGFLWTK
ncbi:hypothetical protein RD792_017258 [Penstemon davidsonii]|uniref:Uncharacterized protein n=1 Tax=Penstemon davidsonii TaxID=160366 RepID=A0ABR0CLI7_9LAMI|nr:hypothetical protein RD792_017258 [Penstemon davidsonii]